MDGPDQAQISGHKQPAIPPAMLGRPSATRVEETHTIGPELARVIGRLMPQLSESATPPDHDALTALVADPAVTLLVASRGERIVGIATVAIYGRVSGTVAHLDDVVVDERARGTGAGEALVRAAAAVARARNAGRLELTSSPWRESANRLYQRLGFKRRETNVYRLDL